MTEQRETHIRGFLAGAGWQDARRANLAGDASNRRYERLSQGPDDGQAVLMDASPEKGENIRPFIAIARYLKSLGLSSPRVLHADEREGLALLEDLGDDLFAHVLEEVPDLETELYLAATDVLLRLHEAPPPAAADYGPATMIPLAGLAHDWYGYGATGRRNEAAKAAMLATLGEAFQNLKPWKPVLVLRDYHAENLFWLPERKGVARVGLIDFQDAGIGHPAYDLVSLARDVRRDVQVETQERMIRHYCSATRQDVDAFRQAAALMSVQRNLRILGVFARLSMHFGKPQYVDLIPRTWAILMEDLAHPALEPLRKRICDDLPHPNPQILAELKAKCGTIPRL
ncbi:aminoglycoside phosphotransferase family protein [Sinisalibacter lacisalsi]|uniref:Aminoglycoside phosphotransferase n=1 Tax=Sinisalibacter lacisalsi TaxID=1526570 RepID=A0ABQ1QCU9_9RHOB|nr:phosphotransferase [Sinisalibacter lacisalsi]GGD21251.1 aminoglycoside phosphotransferase [Sinisalibacter lacisalsi]